MGRAEWRRRVAYRLGKMARKSWYQMAKETLARARARPGFLDPEAAEAAKIEDLMEGVGHCYLQTEKGAVQICQLEPRRFARADVSLMRWASERLPGAWHSGGDLRPRACPNCWRRWHTGSP